MVDLAELRKKTRKKKEASPAAPVPETAAPSPPPMEPAAQPAPQPPVPETPAAQETAPPPPAPAVGFPQEKSPENRETLQFLAFKIGREIYGFPIDAVQEIIPPGRVTRVPNASREIIGIMSLRGIVIPVLDISHFLGQTLAPESADSRIIVLNPSEEMLGVLVDKVLHTLAVAPGQIETPPATVVDEKGLIAGVHSLKDRLLVLLRPEQL